MFFIFYHAKLNFFLYNNLYYTKQSVIYISIMTTTLSDCISENIAKFSQPKNPIYRMVYVINSCDHSIQTFSAKKYSRLVELVDNLNDCDLLQTEEEKALSLSWESRVLHDMTLLSKELFDNIKKGNILVEVPPMEEYCDHGESNFVFSTMTRIA